MGGNHENGGEEVEVAADANGCTGESGAEGGGVGGGGLEDGDIGVGSDCWIYFGRRAADAVDFDRGMVLEEGGGDETAHFACKACYGYDVWLWYGGSHIDRGLVVKMLQGLSKGWILRVIEDMKKCFGVLSWLFIGIKSDSHNILCFILLSDQG